MALGIYPFRCLDCKQRVWVNIWLFSKLHFAKCPKCLGLELTTWPRKHYRLHFWSKLALTFGAHPYRCSVCRHNFLSFRPIEGTSSSVTESSEDEASETLHEETGTLSEPERQA